MAHMSLTRGCDDELDEQSWEEDVEEAHKEVDRTPERDLTCVLLGVGGQSF